MPKGHCIISEGTRIFCDILAISLTFLNMVTLIFQIEFDVLVFTLGSVAHG
jgi:hypothetical protein